LFVLSAAPPPAAAEEKPAAGLRTQLANRVKFIGFDDPKTTLGEALDVMRERYRLPIEVNERAFKEDGVAEVLQAEVAVPNPILPGNCTLHTALNKVLQRIPAQSSATYVIRRDHVEITTQEAVRQEFYPDRAEGDHPPLVIASFRKLSLEDA